MSDGVDERTRRLVLEAEGYFELELFEEAIERCEALLEKGQLVPFALSMQGESLRRLDRFSEGAEIFERLIRTDPRNVPAYVGLGWCRKRAGRLDLALASMERLLDAVPDEPIGLYNLACYAALAGERDRAVDLLRQALERDEQFREMAEEEEDFDALRGSPDFERLLS